MNLKDVARRLNLQGTTTTGTQTVNLGSLDLATLGPNASDESPLALACKAHVLLNDSNGRLRQADFSPLTYLKIGSTVSLDVPGSPTYIITMPSGLIWAFDFTHIVGTVLTVRFTSDAGATSTTAIASGWLEYDIHY